MRTGMYVLVMLLLVTSCSFATRQTAEKMAFKEGRETVDSVVREDIIIPSTKLPEKNETEVPPPPPEPPTYVEEDQNVFADEEDELNAMLNRMPY